MCNHRRVLQPQRVCFRPCVRFNAIVASPGSHRVPGSHKSNLDCGAARQWSTHGDTFPLIRALSHDYSEEFSGTSDLFVFSGSFRSVTHHSSSPNEFTQLTISSIATKLLNHAVNSKEEQ